MEEITRRGDGADRSSVDLAANKKVIKMKTQLRFGGLLLTLLLTTNICAIGSGLPILDREPVTESVEVASKIDIILIIKKRKKGVAEVVQLYPDVPTVMPKGAEALKAEAWLEGDSFYCGWPGNGPLYKTLKFPSGLRVPVEIARNLGAKKEFKLAGSSIKMADPPIELKAIF